MSTCGSEPGSRNSLPVGAKSIRDRILAGVGAMFRHQTKRARRGQRILRVSTSKISVTASTMFARLHQCSVSTQNREPGSRNFLHVGAKSIYDRDLEARLSEQSKRKT
jgi:hypothetical protein